MNIHILALVAAFVCGRPPAPRSLARRMAEVAHARPATPAHVSHSPHSAQNHAARAIERQSKRGGLRAALERDPPPSCTDTAEDLPAPTADNSCPAWTSEREAAGVQQKRQPLDWRL